MVAAARLFLAALLLASASPAAAKGKGFFERYNLGVTYAASASYARVMYKHPTINPLPDDCAPDVQDDRQMTCTAYLAPDADETATPSLFFEEAFKRQGLFFFDLGFAFSTITYKGGIVPKPAQTVKAKPGTKPIETVQPIGLVFMEIYGINWQAYGRVGFTPRYVPDLFLTAGLGLQTAGGKVKMLGISETVFVVQPDVFLELELVIVRAGEAAFSAFIGKSESITTPLGSRIVEDEPAGSKLTQLELGLTSTSAGLRLLFPF